LGEIDIFLWQKLEANNNSKRKEDNTPLGSYLHCIHQSGNKFPKQKFCHQHQTKREEKKLKKKKFTPLINSLLTAITFTSDVFPAF
jgi:hypothetical protein